MLRRIDRLRRGIDTVDSRSRMPIGTDPITPSDNCECPCETLRATPVERRPYAPNPLGEPCPSSDKHLPPSPTVTPIENYFMTVNLGTLLDILA